MNKFFNDKALVKKVNYLLKTVNLSLNLLSGLSKRRVYKLLKKAQRINPELLFDKKELKQISKLISSFDITKKNKIKVLRKVLKLKDVKVEQQLKEKYIIPSYAAPFVHEFIDESQVMIC